MSSYAYKIPIPQMAKNVLMKYISVLLLVCLFALSACSSDMDNFLEEMSEPEMAQMYYTDTLTVAHWNIGHFALGRSSDTTIFAEESESMSSIYKALLDSIDADIIGICEYNPTFSRGGEKSSSYIFTSYPFNCIGAKYSYNCNAIFSRAKLNNSKIVFFEHCVQQRYYVVSEININGHMVFFVETHLDWNQGIEGKGCRTDQIKTLVNAFSDYPYVIICADYNVSDVREFQLFVDADFTLTNGGGHEVVYTSPASNPKHPLDNIIVKGFNVLDLDVKGDCDLSDHCLIKSRLTIEE